MGSAEICRTRKQNLKDKTPASKDFELLQKNAGGRTKKVVLRHYTIISLIADDRCYIIEFVKIKMKSSLMISHVKMSVVAP